MLNCNVRFDPFLEDDDGNGWVLSYGETTETFATITALTSRIQVLYSQDEDVIDYFYTKARDAYVTSNQSTINSNRNTLMTAEGLTPPT